MIKRTVSTKHVINLLNELLEIDYDAIHKLIFTRVKCNNKLAEHPTVQVQFYKKDKYPKVGLLGILNGMFGIREDGMGAICMVLDKGGIVNFREVK